MKEIEVLDVYGDKVCVDESARKLLSFDNKTRRIMWSAPVCENGEQGWAWTDYVEDGVIEDIDLKMTAHMNPAKTAYAYLVNFDSSKYDPDNKVWNKIVEYVKTQQEKYFDEYGNFRSGVKDDYKVLFGKDVAEKVDAFFNPNK